MRPTDLPEPLKLSILSPIVASSVALVLLVGVEIGAAGAVRGHRGHTVVGVQHQVGVGQGEDAVEPVQKVRRVAGEELLEFSLV